MIRTETDLHECQKLWNAFSPQQDAWDDWDLMYAFHDRERHQLNFLVHETNNGEPDGLVPLVYDSVLSRYMLMGGSYPDGRILWIKNADFPEIFDSLSEKTVFFDLRHDWVDQILEEHPQFAENCTEQDLRYHLVPAEFDFDFHHHLDTFPPEKKQKFLYDLRNIGKRQPILNWSHDDESALFVGLVNRNFGDKSDYNTDEDADEVRRVIRELKQSDRLLTLTVEVDGQKQAVSMSSLHGNKMVALYASSNNDFNNLGKLLNVETIQEACRRRVDEISYMTGMKWKSDWRMKSEPCRTMRKPPAPWPDPPA